VMAFAVGVYLPFELNVPIFLGGIVAWLVARHLDKTGADHERRNVVERMGLLAAAGFITGEALLGIGIAVPTAILTDPNDKTTRFPLGLFEDAKGDPAYADFWVPSVIFVVIALGLLYVLALRKPRTAADKS